MPAARNVRGPKRPAPRPVPARLPALLPRPRLARLLVSTFAPLALRALAGRVRGGRAWRGRAASRRHGVCRVCTAVGRTGRSGACVAGLEVPPRRASVRAAGAPLGGTPWARGSSGADGV